MMLVTTGRDSRLACSPCSRRLQSGGLVVVRDMAMFAVPVLLQQLLQSLEGGAGAGELRS